VSALRLTAPTLGQREADALCVRMARRHYENFSSSTVMKYSALALVDEMIKYTTAARIKMPPMINLPRPNLPVMDDAFMTDLQNEKENKQSLRTQVQTW